MKQIILFLSIFTLLVGCSDSNSGTSETSSILLPAGNTADFPQMTIDHNGDILAWWVETDEETKEPVVYFSSSSVEELSFQESKSIPSSANVNPGHGESMPKLVVKPDGTYVLIFTRRNKESKAPFASSVLYTQSFDEGESWTKPELIHSDTNPDNGHGFPEAILLPDGEVGAVWLDGRNQLGHSQVYFAKTEGRSGFIEDRPIGGPSCECCKLDMYVDANSELHLAYRSLTKDNIRDIVHLKSSDNGKHFSNPKRISKDNWQVNACPHNGPSVSKAGQGLYMMWYTLGGGEGIYYTRSTDNGETFENRKQLAHRGKHLYIAALDHSGIAVWDEVYREEDEVYRRVRLAKIPEKEPVSQTYLGPPGVEASMPYLLKLNNKKVIATWTQHSEKGNQIYFQTFTDVKKGEQMANAN